MYLDLFAILVAIVHKYLKQKAWKAFKYYINLTKTR